MLELAQSENISIMAVVVGFGIILTALQIGGMVFKYRGERDPAVKDEIDGIQREVTRIGEATMELQMSISGEMKELGKAILETRTRLESAFKSIDRDRADFHEASNKLERKIDHMDHAVRGNGGPGLQSQIVEMKGVISNMAIRMEAIQKMLDMIANKQGKAS